MTINYANVSGKSSLYYANFRDSCEGFPGRCRIDGFFDPLSCVKTY
jgi:hypothetical protein